MIKIYKKGSSIDNLMRYNSTSGMSQVLHKRSFEKNLGSEFIYLALQTLSRKISLAVI